MRNWLCILLLMLPAVPVHAQESEADTLRGLGMYGDYALGDLAVTDIRRGNDPLQQLKRFFIEAKLPLTSAEERQLRKTIDSVIDALQKAKDDAGLRRANQEFSKSLFATLTPDQQTALRRYRNQQIMERGGFPALKLTLDNAQTPLTDEQETQITAIYKEFSQQADQLSRSSNGNPDKTQLDKLESEALGKVVKLLTPAQRRSLQASRLSTVNGSRRP